MRLTSDPNEEASRNARYSKQPSECLSTGARGTSDTRTGKLPIHPIKLPLACTPTPSPTGRLPSPPPPLRGSSLRLDCVFWYQQAYLGPAAALIGQSAPLAAANKPRKRRNVPAAALTVISARRGLGVQNSRTAANKLLLCCKILQAQMSRRVNTM